MAFPKGASWEWVNWVLVTEIANIQCWRQSALPLKMSLGPVFLLSHPKVCVPGLAGSEVYGIWLFAA